MSESWLIIGGGVSGLGAAKLLRKKGHNVRVSDAKSLPQAAVADFSKLDVEICDGGHSLDHLNGIDSIIISPGFPPSHELLKAARKMQIPIQTEIDYALENFSGKLIAVTGTNGKSTTCAILGHIFSKAGISNSIGGNFGDPPCAILAEGRMGDVLILEISSYQLEGSRPLRPDVGIFTSFSHDHIARHGSLEAYFAAKWKLFSNIDSHALTLIPHSVVSLAQQQQLFIPQNSYQFFDEKEEMFSQKSNGFTIENEHMILSSGKRLSLADAHLKEFHNLLNSAFALLSLQHISKVAIETSTSFLSDFKGLSHRCELIGYINNYPVINDSKSTNVESTLVAIRSQNDPVILFMGGQGKIEPYTPILSQRAKIRAVVAFGASSDIIANELQKDIPTFQFPTLRAALDNMSPIILKYPACILFSPGCASFDEFENYEHRGITFQNSVKNHEDYSPYKRH